MHLSNDLLSELTSDEWNAMFEAIKETTVEMGLSVSFQIDKRAITIDSDDEMLACFIVEYLELLGVDVAREDLR
jgi:hypothetical protein